MSAGELNENWAEHGLECPLHGTFFDVHAGDFVRRVEGSPINGSTTPSHWAELG